MYYFFLPDFVFTSDVLIIHDCIQLDNSEKILCIKQNAQLLSKNVRETC